MGKGKKVAMIAGIVVVALIVAAGVALAVYVDNNRHGEERDLERAFAAGFTEKQLEVAVEAPAVAEQAAAENDAAAAQSGAEAVDDGQRTPRTAVINYAEGPDNGPALLLVHGQSTEWEDYARALPDLAQRYHVFAVDCFGHGESTHDPALYSLAAQGAALQAFAAQAIGGSYTVTGQSSGGIVAAWLAANDAENVTACLLEDPPFFRVTPEEMQQAPGCFVWEDGFTVTHAFLNQDEVDDYAVYYAQHSYLFGLFGGLQPKIAEWTAEERAANPDGHLVVRGCRTTGCAACTSSTISTCGSARRSTRARSSTASTRQTSFPASRARPSI